MREFTLSMVQLVVFTTILLWIFGLGMSFLVSKQGGYLTESRGYVNTFLQKFWRYIVAFTAGYLLAGGLTVSITLQ